MCLVSIVSSESRDSSVATGNCRQKWGITRAKRCPAFDADGRALAQEVPDPDEGEGEPVSSLADSPRSRISVPGRRGAAPTFSQAICVTRGGARKSPVSQAVEQAGPDLTAETSTACRTRAVWGSACFPFLSWGGGPGFRASRSTSAADPNANGDTGEPVPLRKHSVLSAAVPQLPSSTTGKSQAVPPGRPLALRPLRCSFSVNPRNHRTGPFW